MSDDVDLDAMSLGTLSMGEQQLHHHRNHLQHDIDDPNIVVESTMSRRSTTGVINKRRSETQSGASDMSDLRLSLPIPTDFLPRQRTQSPSPLNLEDEE